jgi:exodeoxyribonuclease VII large subunit
MTLWEPGDPDVEGPKRGPTDEPTEPPDVTWTVAEVGDAVAAGLRAAFPDEIWLRGEIRSLRAPNRSGHRYFDLVEPGAAPGDQPSAKVSVALYRSAKERVNAVLADAPGQTRIADGVEVRIRGRVDWWVAGGQLRVVMSGIDPVFTLGRLDEQRRLLLELLVAEGLLRRNATLVVPVLPLRIGLVTSAGSAAHADFVHELAASGYAFDVVLADARVQGADAPGSVVAAIERVTALGVDVIAVVRGGGATTDLAAFDHELIARAIALAPVPVFTGIGHEIDRNVAGEVAHTDFKTPTATAAALVARIAEVEQALDERRVRITQSADRRMAEAAERLEGRTRRIARAAQVAGSRADAHLNGLRDRLTTAAPRRLQRVAEHLEQRKHVLDGVAPRHLRRATERLDATEARVHAYDPARVLARGWSLTRAADGHLVRDPSEVAAGDTLITTLAGGQVTSTVESDDPATPQP